MQPVHKNGIGCMVSDIMHTFESVNWKMSDIAGQNNIYAFIFETNYSKWVITYST